MWWFAALLFLLSLSALDIISRREARQHRTSSTRTVSIEALTSTQ